MKINFLLIFAFTFLIFSINALKDEKKDENVKYLNFAFERNLTLTDGMNPSDFFKTRFYNQIYIYMSVGSEKQKIPFYLYLQQYPLVLQPSDAKKEQVKGIYNPKNSKTYKQILNKETEFPENDLLKGILSEDKFYFNDTSSATCKFYLSTENFHLSHITEGGKIGFQYLNEFQGDKQTSFVTYLKSLDIISGYNVSILYDSIILDENSGQLFIGALPHKIDDHKYKGEDFIELPTSKSSFSSWELVFKSVLLGNKTFDKEKASFLYPEFGFIVGTSNFFENIKNLTNWNKYFNLDKTCNSYNFSINDFEAYGNYRFSFQYTGYYCKKDVNVNDIINQNLTFQFRRPEYGVLFDFIFNNNDLWLEKGDHKYFLILETLSTENCWIFGKPFFKKYHMSFDLDSKIMGVYSNVDFTPREKEPEPKDNTILYICIISGLVIIIAVLTFFLIRFFVYSPRKKRANELLDDNFEYKEGDKENVIMPPEGEKN